MNMYKKLIVVMSIVLITALCFSINVAAYSEGYEIGQAIGSIIFSPFIIVDYLIYMITGIHIFYW